MLFSSFLRCLRGQVQVSSPVPHRYQFTVDASQLNVGSHYKVRGGAWGVPGRGGGWGRGWGRVGKGCGMGEGWAAWMLMAPYGCFWMCLDVQKVDFFIVNRSHRRRWLTHADTSNSSVCDTAWRMIKKQTC